MNVVVVGGAEKGLVVLRSNVVDCLVLVSLFMKVDVGRFERCVECCGCSCVFSEAW